jgi:hypothetical protein
LLVRTFSQRDRLRPLARSRGQSHGRALPPVANHLLNVTCTVIKAGTTFKASLAAPKSLGLKGGASIPRGIAIARESLQSFPSSQF